MISVEGAKNFDFIPMDAPGALPLAASEGSPLFCHYRLQRPNVHRLFGHDVLQLPVLLSSCRSRFASLSSIPPNLLFHR